MHRSEKCVAFVGITDGQEHPQHPWIIVSKKILLPFLVLDHKNLAQVAEQLLGIR